MAVLSWGKPKVEYALVGESGTPGTYETFPEIVEGTAQLTTEEGNVLEATEEGGEMVDTRTSANKYTFTLTLFAKKGETKPIADANGVITGYYAVRLTPEDPAAVGFVMDKTSVSCQETWTSEEGTRWTYTFRGLKPATGNIVKPYSDTTPQG